jgi:hypothetical protein
MGRKRIVKEKELLAAIEGCRGIISTVAARLHVGWHTAERAINDSEKAREAMSDEEETTLDFVEGKAIQRINDGDGAMIRFYLATKGKKRGYSYEERIEDPEGENDDEPLQVICDGPEVEPASVEDEAAESTKADE